MVRLPIRRLFRITFAVAASLPLVAQRADVAPPPGVVDVTRSAGLQRVASRDELRGGGAAYRVWFGAAGMRFEPALGGAVATTQHLALAPIGVRRGTAMLCEPSATTPPVASDLVACYERSPAIRERFAVGADGVELSWHFAQPLAGDGDLVVRYAVDTSLPAPRADGDGLAFELAGIGGVRIGGVTGIDAGGARCRGAVRWVGGQLELSLPADFVACARYPLVLDPTVGTILTVNSQYQSDIDPDVAYDASSACWLAVWLRSFSQTDRQVRGQRIAANGALLGSLIDFGSSGIAQRPRVANLRHRSRFGVVWAQRDGGTNSVEFEALASNGGITHGFTVATSTATLYRDADIGSEVAAALGAERDFVIAFQADNAIQTRRLWFTSADLATVSAVSTILPSAPLFQSYSQPAIARTASDDGALLIVARRVAPGSPDQIVAVAVRTFAVPAGSNPLATIATAGVGESLIAPDVDGYDGRWVVAWQRDGASDTVARAPVSLGSGLVVGPALSLNGPPGFTAAFPSVGFSRGKAWLGYRSAALLGGASLTVRGIDATTCQAGSDYFSTPSWNFDDDRIVVAPQLSGGLTSEDRALAVWAQDYDIYAQILANHGNGGSIQNLGGGCGQNPGTQSFSHNPAIGSNGFRCQIGGLPSGLPTIFNFSTPAPPVPCGACSWLPFSVTVVAVSVAGGAAVEFPIPYLQSLVGAQFETQWTTVSPGQAPCVLVPDFVLSDRAQLTIGQ